MSVSSIRQKLLRREEIGDKEAYLPGNACKVFKHGIEAFWLDMFEYVIADNQIRRDWHGILARNSWVILSKPKLRK